MQHQASTEIIIKIQNMTTVQKIKTEIKALPHEDYLVLLNWIHERDWKEWDEQLEKDIALGKLNFLLNEALAEKKDGKLVDL